MLYTVKILLVLLCIISNNMMGSYDPEKECLGKRPQLSHEECVNDFEGRERVAALSVKVSINPVISDQEMHQVFENAPTMAKKIVGKLKNPCFKNGVKDRAVIFFGIPGTGKTSVAEAIAYKMAIEAGWESNFFSSSDFVCGQRNQSAERLWVTLNEIAAREKPNIVIIDELNQLLENADNPHHDTDATSKALWEFLDAQKNNPRFFLIGIMNRIEKLPVQLKSRWMHRCIEFTEVADQTKKNTIFKSYFNDELFRFSDEIDDSFLIEQLRFIKDTTYRGFYGFACMVKDICDERDQSGERIVIERTHIQQAVSHYQIMLQKMKLDVLQETDAERQERHHRENHEFSRNENATQRTTQQNMFMLQQMMNTANQVMPIVASGGVPAAACSVQ